MACAHAPCGRVRSTAPQQMPAGRSPSARAGRHAAMTTDNRAQAEKHLRALVGRDDATLYDDQWAAISALVEDKRRALVVQRTGWGKSAVYFVPPALLREQGAGPTVIVSPLLAL